MNKDEKFMKEALKEASKAFKKNEVPIGAVLVYKNKIIAKAHNFKESKKSPLAHAEILAIKKASNKLKKWRLLDTTLYVTLEPCAMCAGAIIEARIKKLVFGAFDKKAGACGSLINVPQDKRLNHRVEIKSRVLEKEAQRILKEFFKKLRNKQ